MLPADRAAIYHALAEALGDPPEWMALPGRKWPLYELAAQASDQSEAAREAIKMLASIRPEPLAERRKRYSILFGGPGRPRLWLYESAALHGRPFGPETIALERLYRGAGLSSASAELPDHASLELEFLAYLAECQGVDGNQAEEWAKLERRFIRQHAGRWLPDLGAALFYSGNEVYAPIGKLLSGWLAEAVRIAKVPQWDRLPVIPFSENCTLCGFCVQICPVSALSIEESEIETALQLSVKACTGCGKCELICEMSALKISSGNEISLIGKDQVTLRRSPRATCPACGAPTVSRAELEYVSLKLENPAWLAYCQECRSFLNIRAGD